ncbi:cytochrome c3 family protein [Uliginosibacterium sp. H3]|uniref:Cytochrome c3 family protein n=1 Tax=Uliginosibacterium silvisoli TaxID=3114758 RepID=A0ABU6K375_9RHOO|nr:cytochrome c3 family protein [Uliginosibacterium sp. H3]
MIRHYAESDPPAARPAPQSALRVWRRLAWALCGLVMLLAGSAQAQTGPSPEAIEKARVANEKCFSCHAKEAQEHPPQAGLDMKKLREAVRDRDAFKNSDHGKLACTKCHNEGYDDFPHAADAKDNTSTCSDCHSRKADKIEAEFMKSVHAKNMADTFTCTTCHDPHLMRVASKLQDPRKIVAQDNRVCLGCHDSDETFARFAPEKKTRPQIDEIHAWLPNARMHWQAVRCVECHTPLSHDMLSHEIVNKDKAERRCVTCHSADSQLKVRLYRYLATEEQHKMGFLNSVMAGHAYVVGATRNAVLDTVFFVLAGLTVVGVLVHGLLRFIAARLRRRKKE